MKNEFFGSKLNTVILVVLIILMVFALKLMLKNREIYLHPFSQNEGEVEKEIGTLPQISGNKDDLVSFSIHPGATLQGMVSYRGVIKGAYFFEANIGISIKDTNKQLLKSDHAMATGDWMTVGPVDFEGSIDLGGLPKGPAYFVITADDARDASERGDDPVKEILIPIVIK